MLLLLGLGSRIITVPLIITMVVAYLTTEQEALKVLYSDPDKFVSAAPFQFMLTAITVLIFGPGCFSLDALLARIADRYPPVLHARDRFGRDEDWIEYHPAYREMEAIAFGDFQFHAMSHRGGVLGMDRPLPPVAKASRCLSQSVANQTYSTQAAAAITAIMQAAHQ